MTTPSTEHDVPSQSATSGVPRSLRMGRVVGTDLVVGDYGAVMDWMDEVVAKKVPARLSAASVNLVMSACEDPETAIALNGCVAVPDGQPLVWALQAMGNREASRVYGPELMARYCERSASTGVRMYLYGGRDRMSLDLLVTELTRRYPGLIIAGAYCPPFRPLDEAERIDLVRDVETSQADVIWVGIGQPKQEHWMFEMRNSLGPVLTVGVGAAFDFHAGIVRQAPRWMQRVGLEWLYRLSQEPARLWARYARYNPLFLFAFARQYIRAQRWPR